MIDKYVLASNDDGDLAVRTVQAAESSSVTDTTSVITATDDGKLAVRVVGSGGGDQHNLGWYATEAALESAHATANDGDWAIVGATDTVWVWDSDSTGWKDTGAAGIELPDQTGHSGEFLTTDGTDASWSDKPLVNTSTAASSIAVGGASVTGVDSISIGTRGSMTAAHSVALNGYVSGGGFGVAIGQASYVSATSGTALGQSARVTGKSGISIGSGTASAEHAYQIGYGTNSTAHSLSVGTYHNNTGKNYQLLDLTDGTIPHARLTNAVQSTTVTIATADWSSNTVSVTVSGLTATSVVWVAPDNASQSAYTTAGVYASSQSADTLVFNCVTTPTSALTINVAWC